MWRSGGVAVGLGTALVLAGCGGSGSSGHQGSTPAGSAASGEASKPAAQILSDAQAALRSAGGYVMQGDLIQNGQSVRVRVAATAPNSIDFSLASGSETARLLLLPSGAYIRANSAFWSAHLGPRGGLLADRWVQVPATSAQSISSQLGNFAPGTMARCLAEDNGRLSVVGKTTVTGRPAVVIRDDGDVPGGAPGTLAVASSGPPYPLQARVTGPQHPGGRVDACNDGKGGEQRGTLTLSQFGQVPAIKPPAHAIQFGQTAVT